MQAIGRTWTASADILCSIGVSAMWDLGIQHMGYLTPKRCKKKGLKKCALVPLRERQPRGKASERSERAARHL